MPTNVEVKARATDFHRQKSLAAEIADGPAVLIIQRDTFFRVPHGRLKLREFADGTGELIQYSRPDQATAKTSTYTLVATSAPEAMRRALGAALEIRGEIRKRRWLFITGQTRIHMDEVDGLGHFIELEVVIQDGQPVADGDAIAEKLMLRLGITTSELIDTAYIDLTEK